MRTEYTRNQILTESNTSTPDDLIALAKRGDRDAFGQLYQLLKTSVWRWAYHWIQDPSAAEEIVGDCFVAMINQIDDVPDEFPSLAAWIRRVTHNKCCDLIRRKQSLRKGLRELESRRPMMGEFNPSPIETQETTDAIQESLREMPDEYQIALQWRYLDDLQVQEVADRLNQSLSATNSLLYRARLKLRATLSKRLEVGTMDFRIPSAKGPVNGSANGSPLNGALLPCDSPKDVSQNRTSSTGTQAEGQQ